MHEVGNDLDDGRDDWEPHHHIPHNLQQLQVDHVDFLPPVANNWCDAWDVA